MLNTGIFGKQIIMDDDNPIVHNSSLGKGCIFMCIVGATGTGKSKMVLNILPNFTQDTTDIIICTLICDNPIHNQIKKYCKEADIKFHICYDVPTGEETIENIIEKNGKKGHKVIILDDFTNFHKSDTDQYNMFANKCFSLLRNYNCSVIYITQSYNTIPTKTRTNISFRIVGQCDNIHCIRAISQDTSNLFIEEPFSLMDLYHDIQKDKHAFIILRNNPPEIALVCNNYDSGGKLINQYYKQLSSPHLDLSTKTKKTGGLVYPRERSAFVIKSELYKIAKEMGFPSDRFKFAKIDDIRDFIKSKSAEGEKSAGNNNPEINKILERTKIQYNKTHLNSYIKLWLKTGQESYIDTIIQIATEMLNNGTMSPHYWKHRLEVTGLDSIIDY